MLPVARTPSRPEGMAAMKTLLVHLDASPRAEERLRVARELARVHEAEIDVLYGVPSSVLAVPWVAETGSLEVGATIAALDREQFERARATFDRYAAGGPARWLEPAEDAVAWRLTRHALTRDLLVLGQHDPSDRRAGAVPPDLVPSVVVDSGRPALVVPHAGSFGGGARSVLLAWKPSREAARAATAALPWLLRAEVVHLVTQPESHELEPFDAVEHGLRCNGVAAPIRRHRLGGIEVGQGLLSYAADVDADLLVMGCFGHSRAREWIAGGVTRTVLESMTLPVLMAH